MTWNEVDFRTKVWVIPPERRKEGKDYPHRVPLSRQAMTILRKRDRSKMLVFLGESGVGHISKENLVYLLSDTADTEQCTAADQLFRNGVRKMGKPLFLERKA